LESATESPQKPLTKNRLFFVLSGEHTSLPTAEIRAILDSAGVQFDQSKESYRLLIAEAPQEALRLTSERSLMYDWCGIVLGECEASKSEIHKLVRALPLNDLAKNNGTFAVRSVRLGGVNKTLRRVDLERELGAVIKQQVPRLRVGLTKPDLTFACVIYENSFMIGISAYSKPSGLIAPRRPRKRPAFHPSTMPPKIARCMVNLARAKPGGSFLDPFSGVGGISIEAAVIGCEVLGADADLRMLRAARRNLRYFGLDALGLLHGDARRMPFRSVDAIATDPPYGRGSSTLGVATENLVRDFLAGAGGSLKKGAHLCISSPVETQITDYASDAGFRMIERHLAKVHRSLTRQFVVLQNP
jgi:tRNA (guanine10-N2)-dimethyltransferase